MTLAAASGAISIRNVSKLYDPSGVNVLAIDNWTSHLVNFV